MQIIEGLVGAHRGIHARIVMHTAVAEDDIVGATRGRLVVVEPQQSKYRPKDRSPEPDPESAGPRRYCRPSTEAAEPSERQRAAGGSVPWRKLASYRRAPRIDILPSLRESAPGGERSD